MTIPSGARLGPYEVISLLGAGGMGEVYRARDTRLGREVAIKVLPPALASDPERLKRFEREARSASSLNHPNIVTIYDIGSSDAVSYIAMELVNGDSLREVLLEGALPVRRLLQIGAQIAEGVAKAHGAGIVHRDLKPENVMVTEDGLVKILDFGLAKLTQPDTSGSGTTQAPTVSGATEEGVVLGTVAYMSPEQAAGGAVDYRSDQFSIGSILYEMATGRRAFVRSSAPETLTAIIREEPEPIAAIDPRVPTPLRWIVERCLAKQPKGRYASTEDLARDLATVRDRLSEATASGASASVPTDARAKPWYRRVPIAAAAGIGVLMLASAASFVIGARTRKIPIPTSRRLTFRRGELGLARFQPDEKSVVYGASWDANPYEIFTSRLDGPESRSLGLPSGDVAAVSPKGTIAVSLGRQPGPGWPTGTLAEASALGGGAPREILLAVNGADYSPDGKEMAVVRQEKERFLLEYPLGKVLCESPHVLALPRISPSAGRVAFLEEAKTGVDLCTVDRAGTKEVVSSGWSRLNGIAWFPGKDEIWFSAWRRGVALAVYSIEPGKPERLRWQPVGAEICYLEDIARDGRLLVKIASYRRGIACLPPGETVERDLSWYGLSAPLALADDGTKLLFQEDGGGSGGGAYLRKTDGSPPVRLSERQAMALSPDGRWVLLAIDSKSPSELRLIPTGAGVRKVVKLPDTFSCEGGEFFPDGRRLVVACEEKGHPSRLYDVSLGGGTPRPITPEGVSFGGLVSPDGESILASATDNGPWLLYPTQGGAPRPLAGLRGHAPDAWSADGKSLYVHEHKFPNLALFRFNLRTDRKELWKEIRTSDPAGTSITAPFVSSDGRSYAYGYRTMTSDLYLIEGLR